jgi:N-acetylmuramoyl-L-alanine amidase
MRSNNQNHGVWRLCWLALNANLLLLTIGLIRAQTTSRTAGSQGPSASLQTPAAPSPPVQPPSPSIPNPQPLVMIDPAHGGSESGAALNPAILEKDVTLAMARRLRADLNARGIVAELMRDGDETLSTDDRAAKANSEHPVLYICLHATSAARGMRIYSAMLGEEQEKDGPFVDWNTAQSSSLASSRSAQQQLAAAIQKNGIPARSLQAPLRPLNNVTTTALGIELGPTTADVSQLMSADYQQNAAAALADGIAAVLSAMATNPGASQ